MSKTDISASIGFFERYLSIWVALCIGAGIQIDR